MVIISEKSIEEIILDVAPKIEKITGWNCGLDTLTLKICKRRQFYRETMETQYENMGISTKPKTWRGRKEKFKLKRTFPYIPWAVYEPTTESIVVVPDNLSALTNKSGLATLMGHELFHRCQDIHNPRFREKLDQIVRESIGPNLFDGGGNPDLSEQILHYMTLIEGDATFVERQLGIIFYKNAVASTHIVPTLFGGCAYILSKEWRKKYSQYNRGLTLVKNEYKKRRRKGVNSLYQISFKALRNKIFRKEYR